jgi:flagellin-like hook-associated protein FlgL
MSKQPLTRKISATLCALFVLLLQSSLTFAALNNSACVLPTSAQQMAFVPLITESVQPNPNGIPPSYGLVTLANVPPGYSVTNGNYIGWCMDPLINITPGVVHNPIMYDTYDLAGLASIGVPTAGNVWNKINYIINHKPIGANASTIQAALWRFINFDAGEEAALVAGTYGFGFPAADLATINAIEADANANGASFVPGPSELTAIYLDLPIPPQTIPRQPFIIEVLCPVLGSIGDTVFCDLNKNGIQDAGDLGIPNVQVNLVCVTTSGTVNQSTTTDANGKYLFTGLEAGNCTVSVNTATLPPDCNQIIPNCPTTRTVALAPGQTLLDVDFCFGPPPGSIGDTVFCDLNKNGIQDVGDLGIPNVQVNLVCVTAAGTVNQSTTTDANGKYLFINIDAGTCTVSVNTATLPADCNQIIPNCPTTRTVALAQGQTFLDADFCFGRPPGSIGDTVFCDLNRNGIQDLGDLGIPNVQVNLVCFTATGAVNQSTTTDANGKYLFTGIEAGDCTVSVNTATLPPGCNQIIPNCPTTRAVALAPGETRLDVDFCFGETPGSIGDTVFCDLNENGIQDVGDFGIPNVQVNLVCVTATGTVNRSTTTDANGKYLFSGLSAGNCAVSVNTATLPPDCNKIIPNCPITRSVALAQGETRLDVDLCFGRPPGSIGDTVFCDLNRNGIQDLGDLGIPNVQVNLVCVTATGTVTLTTTTNASGKYLFTGLNAGNCTVSVNTASLPPDCNVIIPNCPTTRTVALAQGQNRLDVDFCFGKTPAKCLFLVIDEDCIDNTSPGYYLPPNTGRGVNGRTWSASDVNDDRTRLAQRTPLRFFNNPANFGRQIVIRSGQVGDEGLFAVKTIPNNWATAGPTNDGLKNYIGDPCLPYPHNVGNGLGTGNDPESRLDKIPNVTPLRAAGLKGLIGRTVCAIVYDSDISINYSPLNGSLKGETNGVVAFKVLEVKMAQGFSSSTLPLLTIEIVDPCVAFAGGQELYLNAPVPVSSSVPADITP